MKAELLKKLNAEEATGTDLSSALDAIPVTENVSGLVKGETILSVGSIEAIFPVIRGVKNARPSVILICETMDIDGTKREKPVYLSSLIRKTRLEAAYTGLIADDKLFSDAAMFNNKKWAETFKAAAPFYVESMTEETRPANINGTTQNIRSRQAHLVKGQNPDVVALLGGTNKGGKKAGAK